MSAERNASETVLVWLAHSNSDTRGSGGGCAMWFGDLNDLRVHLADAEHDLYVRVPASVLETNNESKVKIGAAIGGTVALLWWQYTSEVQF